MNSLLHQKMIATSFSANPLNRADNLRGKDGQWDLWQQDPDSLWLVTTGEDALLMPNGLIDWQPYSKVRWTECVEEVFLGLEDGAPRFARLTTEDSASSLSGDLLNIRTAAYRLGEIGQSSHPDLGIMAQAKSMLSWHQSHRFCSQCGAKSTPIKAGYERTCESCAASHFPRTDPVVIMLGIHQESDSILVGRPPNLHDGVFTALAGFMEPGERIEEAVARELFEEAGVTTTNVRYIASQPWPWPSSLMIGCHADIQDRDFIMDAAELEELKWMSRAEATAVMKGEIDTILFPPPLAIARQLIDHWLAPTAG